MRTAALAWKRYAKEISLIDPDKAYIEQQYIIRKAFDITPETGKVCALNIIYIKMGQFLSLTRVSHTTALPPAFHLMETKRTIL